MIWYLIGVWAQQLRMLSPIGAPARFARFSVLTLVVLLVPFTCFACTWGCGGRIRPDDEDAGLVMPAILAIYGIVTSNCWPALSCEETLRAGVGAHARPLYAWAMVRTRLNQSVPRIANWQQRKTSTERVSCPSHFHSCPSLRLWKDWHFHTQHFSLGTAWFLSQEIQ